MARTTIAQLQSIITDLRAQLEEREARIALARESYRALQAENAAIIAKRAAQPVRTTLPDGRVVERTRLGHRTITRFIAGAAS